VCDGICGPENHGLDRNVGTRHSGMKSTRPAGASLTQCPRRLPTRQLLGTKCWGRTTSGVVLRDNIAQSAAILRELAGPLPAKLAFVASSSNPLTMGGECRHEVIDVRFTAPKDRAATRGPVCDPCSTPHRMCAACVRRYRADARRACGPGSPACCTQRQPSDIRRSLGCPGFAANDDRSCPALGR
jgi:hypothetical protein